MFFAGALQDTRLNAGKRLSEGGVPTDLASHETMGRKDRRDGNSRRGGVSDTIEKSTRSSRPAAFISSNGTGRLRFDFAQGTPSKVEG
jgi:hypothetical protein